MELDVGFFGFVYRSNQIYSLSSISAACVPINFEPRNEYIGINAKTSFHVRNISNFRHILPFDLPFYRVNVWINAYHSPTTFAI